MPASAPPLSVTCMSCGSRVAGTSAIAACPTCGGLLDADIDTSQRLTPEDFVPLPGTLEARSGVWRFRKLLPAIPDEAIVSRWEGNNPLYDDPRLAEYAGLTGGRFAVKHEGHNPTASFN